MYPLTHITARDALLHGQRVQAEDGTLYEVDGYRLVRTDPNGHQHAAAMLPKPGQRYRVTT